MSKTSTDAIDWKRVLACREFWLLYYELALDWDSRAGRKKWKLAPDSEKVIWAFRELLQGREIRLHLGKGHDLVIVLESGASHQLYLSRGRSRQLLGWVDGQFHPDVFRWSEFQRIVSVASAVSANCLSAPAIYLLLFLYVGISASDDLRELGREFRQQLKQLKLFSADEMGLFSEGLSDPESRISKLTWVEDPKVGWVVEGGYSLRSLEPGYKFNWVAFRRFIRNYET